MKCSRRIRPIVSTTSIPHRPLHAKAGSRTNRKFGGQSWTPIPRLMGSFFHAGSHERLDNDASADRNALNTRADGADHSGDLVADDARKGHIGVLAEVNVEIAGAKAGRPDLHLDLPGP